jgi:hypothetical protein
MEQVGYYTQADQAVPHFNPNHETTPCPVCDCPLKEGAIMTISCTTPGTGVSCFYRAHKDCWMPLSDEQKSAFDREAMALAERATDVSQR